MDKYSQGKIYKLVNDNTGLCYVGSTIERYLSTRLAKHKDKYKRYLKGCSHFVTSFKVLEQEGYRIELIEHFPCQSKYELENRERYYIENMDCVNNNIPTRTFNEYYEDNREMFLQKASAYYKANKDKIKQQKKEYTKKNKDVIQQYKKEYYENNIEKIKQYRELNKNKRKELWAVWSENNKDKLKQKHNCECGGRYTHQKKSQHFKTKKHILYIENQQIEK